MRKGDQYISDFILSLPHYCPVLPSPLAPFFSFWIYLPIAVLFTCKGGDQYTSIFFLTSSIYLLSLPSPLLFRFSLMDLSTDS